MRRRFALVLLSGSMSPDNADTGFKEYYFPINDVYLTAFQVQAGQVWLKEGSGFSSDAYFVPVSPSSLERRSLLLRNGKNRQMRQQRRFRQLNTVASYHSPSANPGRDHEDSPSVFHLDVHRHRPT